MNADRRNHNLAGRHRRYLVHLSCVLKEDGESRHYLVRVRPAFERNSEFGERDFQDDCDLISAINPLLPPGSDLRDVFGHIENSSGFFYLLWLSDKQAQQLGWNRSFPDSTSA